MNRPTTLRSLARASAVLAIAALLLVAVRFATSAPSRISVLPSLQVDAQAYDTIARELSERWTPDVIPIRQPPGFVAFLAGLYTVFGQSWTVGRLALWACLIALTVLAGYIARAIYSSEAAGWCAALLCASSPALRAYTGTLQYEIVAGLMLLALVAAARRLPVIEGAGRQLLAAAVLGVALGVAALTREVLMVVAPVIAAYVFVRIAPLASPRRAAVVTLCSLVCAAAPPMAWSAAQSARTGHVVAVSDKGPLVLAYGNNPAANGTFNASRVGVPEPSGWPFIASRPADALRLSVRKFLYFWGFLRDGWNVPRASAFVVARASAGALPLQWILPWSRGGWLLIFFLLAFAMWSGGTWRVWWHLPASIVAVMAVHLLTLSSYRFAIPVLPLVIVVASGAIVAALQIVWRRRRLRVAAAMALLLVLVMQVRSWPMRYELLAADLDGDQTTDRPDDTTGEMTRFADPGGRRPALLLTDEYLAAGALTLEVTARVEPGVTSSSEPVMTMSLVGLDGSVLCSRTVHASEMASRSMGTLSMPCHLARSQPATLIVGTLGTMPLAFGHVRFVWSEARGVLR